MTKCDAHALRSPAIPDRGFMILGVTLLRGKLTHLLRAVLKSARVTLHLASLGVCEVVPMPCW